MAKHRRIVDHGRVRVKGRTRPKYEVSWFDGADHLVNVDDDAALQRTLRQLAARGAEVKRWEFRQLRV